MSLSDDTKFKSNKRYHCRSAVLVHSVLRAVSNVAGNCNGNWEIIFYGHYRFIFNHCDLIGLKICQIRRNAK